MTQTAIPFLFMRGGTSRGPYLNRADLPADLETLAQVLVAMIGSGHPLNIDGIGGGNAVTTKVAMLSLKPTCGNILSGVGPAAIEMGLIAATPPETTVNIRAVNTGARVVAKVQTTEQGVVYEGIAAIDGVPGTAAPVGLQFMDTVGGATGAFLPTGRLVDTFDGIDVTCMDVAMPMVIARATAFGLTGYESVEDLNENADFFAKMEAVRIQAGEAMGIKDVAASVTPKFGLLAPAKKGGTIATRYFMPWKAHPTMAVTGAQCLASCVLTPGTVADGMAARSNDRPATVTLEHASGQIDVLVDYDLTAEGINLRSAGLVRTARLLARGDVMIPKSVLR